MKLDKFMENFEARWSRLSLQASRFYQGPERDPFSMRELLLHTCGKGNADSYCSCSHGAGRAMSRTAARNRFSISDLIAHRPKVLNAARTTLCWMSCQVLTRTWMKWWQRKPIWFPLSIRWSKFSVWKVLDWLLLRWSNGASDLSFYSSLVL